MITEIPHLQRFDSTIHQTDHNAIGHFGFPVIHLVQLAIALESFDHKIQQIGRNIVSGWIWNQPNVVQMNHLQVHHVLQYEAKHFGTQFTVLKKQIAHLLAIVVVFAICVSAPSKVTHHKIRIIDSVNVHIGFIGVIQKRINVRFEQNQILKRLVFVNFGYIHSENIQFVI